MLKIFSGGKSLPFHRIFQTLHGISLYHPFKWFLSEMFLGLIHLNVKYT